MSRFVASKCNFQGEPGYMVSQLHEGKVVARQFVAASVFDRFCAAIGIVPEIAD